MDENGFGLQSEGTLDSNHLFEIMHVNSIPFHKLNGNSEFEVKVTIKELFDTNGNKVPKDQWTLHQIILTK